MFLDSVVLLRSGIRKILAVAVLRAPSLDFQAATSEFTPKCIVYERNTGPMYRLMHFELWLSLHC